jgi:hypothetical protein
MGGIDWFLDGRSLSIEHFFKSERVVNTIILVLMLR